MYIHFVPQEWNNKSGLFYKFYLVKLHKQIRQLLVKWSKTRASSLSGSELWRFGHLKSRQIKSLKGLAPKSKLTEFIVMLRDSQGWCLYSQWRKDIILAGCNKVLRTAEDFYRGQPDDLCLKSGWAAWLVSSYFISVYAFV